MKKFLWILTAIGSALGGLGFLLGIIVAADNASLRATAAAVGIAFAVIPYCLARAATEMGK